MFYTVEFRDRVTSVPQTFNAHAHGHYEIYSYFGGEGIYLYFVGDTMFELVPGDVIIIRPGVLHTTFKRLKVRYQRLYAGIDAQMLETVASNDPDVMAFLRSGAILVHPDGELAREYTRLTNEIRQLKNQDIRYREIPILARLLEQVNILAQASKNSPITAAFPENDCIRRTIAYINENYAVIGSIGDIADAMGYSKNHLSAVFKREMNVGLHEFLMQKRLAVAAAKLRTGTSVTECALECGIGSTSHFISVFKKAYGVTPKAYQEQNIIDN